jgi:hypothetical protein
MLYGIHSDVGKLERSLFNRGIVKIEEFFFLILIAFSTRNVFSNTYLKKQLACFLELLQNC